MNSIDIALLIVLVYGFVRGLLKGLFVEVASLVALVVGIYGAYHFSYFLSDWLQEHLDWKENYISLTAFTGTFLLIVLAISFTGKILTKIADFFALGIINKILGGLFGMLKFALILSVLIIFFNRINNTFTIVKNETLEQSILYQPIKKVVPFLLPKLDEETQNNIKKQIEKTI